MTGLSASGETVVLAPLTTNAFVSLHTADPGPTGISGEVVGRGLRAPGPDRLHQCRQQPDRGRQ